MRSLIRGEFDEVDEKMKHVENEVGLVQQHQAEQKVSLDAVSESLAELRKLTNMMTSSISDLKK
jgi:hypothetical protein